MSFPNEPVMTALQADREYRTDDFSRRRSGK